MPYPAVDPKPNFPALEEEILAVWAKEETFEQSVEHRAAGEGGENEFVFYDGPPFANGLPHYGHLLTGFVKDAIPRYQTMLGRRVERRFGEGLPRGDLIPEQASQFLDRRLVSVPVGLGRVLHKHVTV